MDALGSTSLDLLERAGTKWGWVVDDGPGSCPKFPRRWVNPVTDERRGYVSCKSIYCDVCGPKEVMRRMKRVASMRPERFMTLTQLDPWLPEARRQEKEFRRIIRRMGYSFEAFGVHELTQKGDRHGHYLQRGQYIPQRLISRAATRAGMGSVADIRAIKGQESATGYVFKEALQVVRYAMKGREQLNEHLTLNGGKLGSSTRGFYRA